MLLTQPVMPGRIRAAESGLPDWGDGGVNGVFGPAKWMAARAGGRVLR